jgi:signal transduction histidine kinase
VIEAEALTSTDASLPDGFGARLVAVADRERRRLARDLHDGAQQRLVSLSLRLRLLSTQLAPGSEPAQLLEAARQELAESLKELREFARGVHPAILSDHGLPAALDVLAARAPVPVELDVQLRRRLPEAVEVASYYLVCEAITNVAKYAQAATARVSVALRGDQLVVAIVDDGDGGADPDAGSGLRGLMDRVEALGGRLDITSPYAAGTTLMADLPVGSERVSKT